MQRYLILVCNASRASIYESHEQYPKKNLQLITELTHPESRKKGSELTTDRAGRYQTGHDARSAYEAKWEPKELAKDNFSRIIAHYLEEYYKKQSFLQLIIIAPSHFWGLLEKHLSKSITQSISNIIQKDYTLSTQAELLKILQSA